MPGRRPYEAVHGFVDACQDTVSCITSARLQLSGGGYRDIGVPHALFYRDPVLLGHSPPYYLRLDISYRIEDRGTQKPRYKIRTTKYRFGLFDEVLREIIVYHWDPDGIVATPHLHVGPAGIQSNLSPLTTAHIPTGRISLEEVVRFSIRELGVAPQRDNWATILDANQHLFEQARTWPISGGT